jgi:hypothetical protein
VRSPLEIKSEGNAPCAVHSKLNHKAMHHTQSSRDKIRRQCTVRSRVELRHSTLAQTVVTAVRNLATVSSIFLGQPGLIRSSEVSMGGGSAIVFRSGDRRRPCNQPYTTNSPSRTCRFKHTAGNFPTACWKSMLKPQPHIWRVKQASSVYIILHEKSYP